MPLALGDVLGDPTVAAADPVVLAGAAHLDRAVTWVHTSEMLDIAPLLRGGELLLVGGIGLATVSPQLRRGYIRDLSAAGAAGLAVETGAVLPVIPEEMLVEAERIGFPIVELRRVVRFVEVTQAVNGLLINESVRRLQLADRVGHALAGELAAGGTTADLVAVLARETGADCVLTSITGERLAGTDPGDGADSTSTVASRCPITSAGVTVAVLTMSARTGTDLLLLDAAADRAPEALGLSLLRSRPSTRIERDTHEFLALAVKESVPAQRFTDLAEALGIGAATGFACVIARFDRQIATAGLDAALRRGDRTSIARVGDDTYQAVVTLGSGVLASTRSALITDLRAAALPAGTWVSVGPGADAVLGIPRSLREASVAIDLDRRRHEVVDAADLAVERLSAAIGPAAEVQAFITEHIGELIAADRRQELFTTLHAYLGNWGNKTDTAAELHLQRQSLYQRLAKVFAVLGDPPPASPRWPAIRMAVDLEVARRRSGGSVVPRTGH